jgi:hypothetical protein
MTVRRLLSALLVALTGLALTVIASDPVGAAGTPTLRLRDAGLPCAGQVSWIVGSGFVPGKAYNFSTSYGRMTSSPITAGPDGTLEVALPIPNNAQTTGYVQLDAEAADNPYVEVAFLELDDFGPVASIDPTTNSPVALAYFPVNSQLHLAVNCFQSGEDVQLSSPQLTLGPASVSYRPDGAADIGAKVLAVNANGMAAVTITGASSGRQAVAKVGTGGNVLYPGTQLEDPGSGQLVSPSGNYRMIMEPGGFYVCHLPATRPNSPCDRTWTMPLSSPPIRPQVTGLQMQSTGNLVMLDGSQRGWSTETVGAGNRLTMRDDGVLALTSPRGDLQWSNKVGTIRGPAGFFSIPYIAGSRAGRAVYVNGLIKRWNGAGQLVRCAHCLVYLQRYLNGGWQYVIARTTDSAGQIAVGFLQPTVYRYRWKVAYAPALTGSISTGIDR